MADYFEIDFLGVETKKSGDAIALRYEKDGATYIHVIDGGYVDTGKSLRDHILAHYGNPTFIHHVVATHNDGDHARGLVEIVEHFDVGVLWMNRPWIYAAEIIDRFETYNDVDRLRSNLRSAHANLAALEEIAERKGIEIREAFQGAAIGAFRVMAPTRGRFLDLVVTSDKTPEAKTETSAFDGFLTTLVEKAKSAVAYIRAAWGAEAFPAEDTSNENEMSVVQYANLCGKKILLTADTGRDGLAEVIAYAPSASLQLPGIDRFQVPHHGGRRNLTTELLNSMLGEPLDSKPQQGHFTAVISSAKEDEDHPRKVVMRAMIHRGANLHMTEGVSFRTSWNAPSREGWSPARPATYPEEYEV
ncbi:competence protein ComEC [Mesorhizobium sp. CU2]|uniref:competence protein ComEC n=1 Tax=unclassified Mesorhizobium TaxID=325217 RepID=UPI00112E087B|nr:MULTISPECIES: competence protein ComEC [unclassified Mesorhizobium]TPN81038.1 competence protein ComEC [Mesorhizobium sp. CU3]TPO05744.1 competence protein ComEC [Mesorhizobium sp. CU2]